MDAPFFSPPLSLTLCPFLRSVYYDNFICLLWRMRKRKQSEGRERETRNGRRSREKCWRKRALAQKRRLWAIKGNIAVQCQWQPMVRGWWWSYNDDASAAERLLRCIQLSRNENVAATCCLATSNDRLATLKKTCRKCGPKHSWWNDTHTRSYTHTQAHIHTDCVSVVTLRSIWLIARDETSNCAWARRTWRGSSNCNAHTTPNTHSRTHSLWLRLRLRCIR